MKTTDSSAAQLMLASDVKATVGGHGAVVAFVGSDNLAVFADSVDLGPFPEGVQTTTARRFDATRGAIAKVSLDRLKGPQLVLQAELIELSHNDGRLTPLAWPVFLRATKKALTPPRWRARNSPRRGCSTPSWRPLSTPLRMKRSPR